MRKINKLITLVLIIAMVPSLSGCDLFRKTNSGEVNIKWYMNLTDDSETPYTIETSGIIAAVALENEYSNEFGIVKDGQTFLNIETITKNIDPRFYWDKQENLVMFTNARNIYETKINSNKINGETVSYVTSFIDGDCCYINTMFVGTYIDFDCKYIPEDKNIPARICLAYSTKDMTSVIVDSDEFMRTGADYQNLIVSEIKEDSKVTVIEEKGNWKKVRTKEGLIGYLPKSELGSEKKEKQEYQSDEKEYTHITMDGKVSLAWNQITIAAANDNLSELLSNVKGLNVISPTWFTLGDKKGNITSLADKTYVKKAKRSGLEVWALFSDLNEQGKAYMPKILAKSETRRRMINQLLNEVKSYQIDGINIDFEYITEETITDYLQFLRELSVECRKNQIVLSIDNYVPTPASEYYDRKQQGMLADYIIVMSYDEHATSVDGAGSVSSLAFTEKGIKDTVEQVGDAKRVINGMPFYTTVWTETPEEYSDGLGTYFEDSANGNYYLTSEDITMEMAKQLYKEAGVTPTFDEQTGQNIVSYQKGNSFVRIWLEDKTSVKARLSLMEQYDIGGAAYWRLGQETDDIWNVIEKHFGN